MKRWVIACISFAFCLSLFVGIGHTADSVIKLDFASFYPATHKVGMVFEEWAKDMEKRTSGRVRVNYYPGETLMPLPQTYDSVVKGVADIGTGAFAFFKGRFPLTEVLDQPIGIKDSVSANRMGTAYVQTFKPKELDDSKLLTIISTGPQLLHMRKPISKLDDLKGLKIRCTGGVAVSVVQALGATPISIPIGDVYDALQKGVIDGVLTPAEALVSFKLGDVVKYTVNNYQAAYSVAGFVIMNKAKWNSLPPDLQKIIDGSTDELREKVAKTFDAMDEESKKTVVSKGHKLITLTQSEEDKWVKAIQPILDGYVKDKAAKGLPAAETLKFCQDWLKKNQK
jgi:TRAP-type transport system periplasmic protein